LANLTTAAASLSFEHVFTANDHRPAHIVPRPADVNTTDSRESNI
jgi:hypothetical protein